MKRKTFSIQISDTMVRHKVKIEDRPSEPDSHDSNRRQFEFLQEILEQPLLLWCGPVQFQRMSMHHTGERWVVEAQAEARGLPAI